MSRHFVKEYFDNKPLEGLQKAITPDWSEANLARHLNLLAMPAGTRRILEIGCGTGRLLIPLYDRGAEHCVGVDASQAMIAAGREQIGNRHIWILPCDGQGGIPLDLGGYFDFAFSLVVFQHIPSTDTVIRYLGEAHRLLATGGVLRFQVLAADIKPGLELWTYHDIKVLVNALMNLGFCGITLTAAGVWTVVGAVK